MTTMTVEQAIERADLYREEEDADSVMGRVLADALRASQAQVAAVADPQVQEILTGHLRGRFLDSDAENYGIRSLETRTALARLTGAPPPAPAARTYEDGVQDAADIAEQSGRDTDSNPAAALADRVARDIRSLSPAPAVAPVAREKTECASCSRVATHWDRFKSDMAELCCGAPECCEVGRAVGCVRGPLHPVAPVAQKHDPDKGCAGCEHFRDATSDAERHCGAASITLMFHDPDEYPAPEWCPKRAPVAAPRPLHPADCAHDSTPDVSVPHMPDPCGFVVDADHVACVFLRGHAGWHRTPPVAAPKPGPTTTLDPAIDPAVMRRVYAPAFDAEAALVAAIEAARTGLDMSPTQTAREVARLLRRMLSDALAAGRGAR